MMRVAASITDTVLSPVLATYSVWVPGSTATPNGPVPTGTAAVTRYRPGPGPGLPDAPGPSDEQTQKHPTRRACGCFCVCSRYSRYYGFPFSPS